MSNRRLKTNFIVNLLYPSARIVVALVTVPLYLHHIGDARYGVMSIVWVLLGLFGFLDLGLSRAVTNALAKLRDAPQPHRARVLLTTFGLNLGIGLMGGVVLYVFGGLLLKHFVSVPDEMTAEVSRSLPWIACLLPLTLHFRCRRGRLESRELFLLVNSIQIVAMTVAQVAPVVAAVFVSPSLTVVIPTAAVAQGLGAIAILTVVYRLEGPFSLRAIDWGEARKLLGYGGWMFATNVFYPALASADQFIIGSVNGRGVGCSLCGADEPCLEERRHPGGVGPHLLSPHVQPVRRCSLRAWLRARFHQWRMALPPFVLRRSSSRRLSFGIGSALISRRSRLRWRKSSSRGCGWRGYPWSVSLSCKARAGPT